MSNVAYIITIALLVAALIVEKVLNHKHVSELHDRLAAKSLEEFKYEKSVRPVELEHNKKMLEVDREKAKVELEHEKKMPESERELRILAKAM